jgi:cytochrome c2
MVTKIACPSCSINLRIAETMLGKRIKCPRCGSSFPTSSGNGVAEPLMEVSAPAEDDDHGDDQEERRPRRKKLRKKKRASSSGGNAGLLVGIVVGAVLLVGTGVTLGIVFWPKKPAEQLASNSEPPRKPASSDRKEPPREGPAEKLEDETPASPSKGGSGPGVLSAGSGAGGGPAAGRDPRPAEDGQDAKNSKPEGGPGTLQPGNGPGGFGGGPGFAGGGGGRGAMPSLPGGAGGGPNEPAGGPGGGGGGLLGPMGPAGAGGGGAGEFAAGQRIFTQNCARCHSMSAGGPAAGGPGLGAGAGMGGRGPAGGGGMGRGPDLSTVGRDPAHTVDWFSKLVRNPKSIRANARMQGFNASRISDADLKALAEFLASLK